MGRKTKMTKYSVIYSQFISVDIKPKNEKSEYVRACRVEDFFKWCLEKKNLKVTMKDLWLGPKELVNLIGEFSSMIIEGWEVETYTLREGCTIVDTEEEVKYFNEGGKEVKEKEVSCF